jgi:hypothetical protein
MQAVLSSMLTVCAPLSCSSISMRPRQGRMYEILLGEMFRASFRFVSSRAHIMVSGNCLGLVASLLKLLNKISQPRGQRSLNGVVLTKSLADCPLNIAR